MEDPVMPMSETVSEFGVISDTHGLLRPEIVTFLKGVSRILHAGDVGSSQVLRELEKIAPVTAVRGNSDSGMLAAFLNDTELIDMGEYKIHLLHDLHHLSLDPHAAGIRLVISGHTHTPAFRTIDGVTYLNPGSAGPKRPGKPISAARVAHGNGRFTVRPFVLESPRPRAE